MKPSKIFETSGLPVGPDKGLLVNRYLQSVKHPDIFGGGDCICFEDKPLDKVGVYAVRQNPVLLNNLFAQLEGRPLQVFDPGPRITSYNVCYTKLLRDNIIKQLSDAYRRIRNTCRFLLGNLNGFEPAEVRPIGTMAELDRFILHRLHYVVKRCRAAYDAYEFHVIYHTLHNFCVVDLSSFYLDIIKDRVYRNNFV